MSSDSEEDFDVNNMNAFLRALLRRDDRLRSNESLISHLKQSGVLISHDIELAFLNVPRGMFLPEDIDGSAYSDSPLRLSKMGFNISAPHMYAMCFEQLDIEPGNHILDIGCGTGHFTVMAGYLTGPLGFVHGVDIHKHIIQFSESNYAKYMNEGGVDMNILFECRNCFLPDPKKRTYDRIHVGACVPESHLSFLQDLLNPGGILVTPYGDRLIKIKKNLNGEFEEHTFSQVRYSDLILPSEAEIQEAKRLVVSERNKVIEVSENTILSELASCINNDTYSDVVFDCCGRTIYGHKFILQLRSEHFRCLFNSGFRESKSGVIDVVDFEYDVFMQIITFMYTGNCLITEENCSDLIRGSDYYQLHRLKEMCELFWYNDINVENAGHLLAFAQKYNAEQLRNYTLEFIFANVNQVVRTESWKEVDQETVTYILLQSISRQ